jgi:uncharacterized membrane protein (DUF4010 family)
VDIEGGKDLAVICVKGVDKMSAKDIASYIRGKTSTMKRSSGGEEHRKKTRPFSFIPAFLVGAMIEVVGFISGRLGISIKAMNV